MLSLYVVCCHIDNVWWHCTGQYSRQQSAPSNVVADQLHHPQPDHQTDSGHGELKRLTAATAQQRPTSAPVVHSKVYCTVQYNSTYNIIQYCTVKSTVM